jgi:hypothetical protein
VNAIPYRSRVPWTRCPGKASYRDVAIIMGLSVSSVKGSCRRPAKASQPGPRSDQIGGTRHAKTARCGVSGARQTAQGRVGLIPRHIALHLGSHRLLSASTSAQLDAERPLRSHRVQAWPGRAGTVRQHISRPVAQPLPCSTPRFEVWGAKLVPAGGNTIAPPRGQSRGKGVLAA